jgi:hypothetical protein
VDGEVAAVVQGSFPSANTDLVISEVTFSCT